MYIRFVTPYWSDDCRSHVGFFRAVRDVYRRHSPDDWRVGELGRQYDWFNERLAVPDRLARKVGRHGLRPGVCWFRDRAAEHVSRARYACWLIEDMGLPIRELRSDRPGTRIWEDAHQIVAIPERDRQVRRL